MSVLYMNVYMNGYLTSVDIEQKAPISPLYNIDQNQVIPYPGPEITRELARNPALENRLKKLMSEKFARGNDFAEMLEYIMAVRKGKKVVQKMKIGRIELI